MTAGMEESRQLQYESQGSEVVRKGQQQLAKQENVVLRKPPSDTARVRHELMLVEDQCGAVVRGSKYQSTVSNDRPSSTPVSREGQQHNCRDWRELLHHSEETARARQNIPSHMWRKFITNHRHWTLASD